MHQFRYLSDEKVTYENEEWFLIDVFPQIAKNVTYLFLWQTMTLSISLWEILF